MEKTKDEKALIQEKGKKIYDLYDAECENNSKVCAKMLAVTQCNTFYKEKEEASACVDGIETHIKEQAEGYRNLMGFFGKQMRK